MFSDIAVRSNGDRITNAWFNALRTAGVNLETTLGSLFSSETQVTIANNQSSAADITSLTFSPSTYTSAIVFTEIRRKTATTELLSIGFVFMLYHVATTTWELIPFLNGDDHGLTFSFSGNQLQYTSSNMSGGSYTGKFKYRAIPFGV